MKLRSVEANFLYDHFYLNHKFVDGVNVIYGNNGSGKTTLLNILANALNGNFNRFVFLGFSSINIEFEDGQVLVITRTPPMDLNEDDVINIRFDEELVVSIPIAEVTTNTAVLEKKYTVFEKFDLPTVLYFPAYRILYDYVDISSNKAINMLSGFSPSMYFPQLAEIEEKLINESLSGNISSELSLFVDLVNKFYENKKLTLNTGSELQPFEIIYEDKYKSKQLTSLSSGERQLTTMLYALSQASQSDIVLIDEPEISLHVAWQRKILKIISSMFHSTQIIACTHSPIIGAEFELDELDLRFVGN